MVRRVAAIYYFQSFGKLSTEGVFYEWVNNRLKES